MAALKKDLYVQSFPEYGPERGGAPMKAYNRIDAKEIKLHCGVYEPDLVAVLDRTLLTAEDVTEGLKKEGALVTNTTVSPEDIRSETCFPGKIMTVDADFIARQTNQYPNVALLGSLMRVIPSIPMEDVEEALRELLAEKLDTQKMQLNIQALRRGYEQTQVSLQGRVKPRASGNAKSARLKQFQELPIGGVIIAENREENQTGGWRQEKPVFDEALCINCLLCWINCPEPAIVTENQVMRGYDYQYCKGCGICFASCPAGAISMIPEAEPVPPLGRLTKLSEKEPAASSGERSRP
jgi:pyruvate ferredoxin oxidoreductase gamma subunit